MKTASNLPLPQQFEFHQDPGHGWLKVPISTLQLLKITHMISDYSFRKDDVAYLEEDVDAPLFVRAYLAACGLSKDDFKYFFDRCITILHHNADFIRRMPRYK